MMYICHVMYCVFIVYLAQLGVIHIGEHFSLANRGAILSVHCCMTLHNTRDYKKW